MYNTNTLGHALHIWTQVSYLCISPPIYRYMKESPITCMKDSRYMRMKRICVTCIYEGFTWQTCINWCCFYNFVRNRLVALLEALCALKKTSINACWSMHESPHIYLWRSHPLCIWKGHVTCMYKGCVLHTCMKESCCVHI